MKFQQPIEHTAFSVEAHGHIQTIDFPMEDAINRLDGTPPPDAQPMALAADGLAEILHWIWQPEKHRRPNLRAAFRRFVSLSMTLNADLLNGLSYRELGLMLGCSRACLSKQALLFSQQFGGLHFRRQHNGRENMRAAAILNHQKRKHGVITTHPTPG
jgi:hypothetical protein